MNLNSLERERYIRLCQGGHAAALQGRTYDAHFYFRQAVELYPFSVNVWVWLARVTDNVEDKRVALENVLAINPEHHDARRMLKEL